MSITEEESFFTENIVNVNKKIDMILFGANLVPITFIIFSHTGLWHVSTFYSVVIILYTTILAAVCTILNRTNKKVLQYISMYLGLVAVSGFIFLLGINGVITLTISYACAPVLSCLYYNRKLTLTTTSLNFILTIIAFWERSFTVSLVRHGVKTPLLWFTQNIPGVIVEFFFIFLIADALAKRTNQTFRRIMSLNSDVQGAYRRLNDKNIEQFNANKELQEKNEYIEKLNAELNSKNANLTENLNKVIEFGVKCFGSFDLFGVQHNYHTGRYVQEISKKLRSDGYYVEELTDEKIYQFMHAALLHDMGKARIPQSIINKIGKYTDEEYEIMKNHPMEGRKLLEELPTIDDGKFNVIAKEMALYHHERWDGSGYPYGISGETIPLCARIMAAADVLDALISPRLYKDPVSVEEAIKVFAEGRGSLFEPCISDAVVNLKNEIIVIDRDFKTYEAADFADNLELWRKYHPELKKFKLKGK